jgi:hypothetical protein
MSGARSARGTTGAAARAVPPCADETENPSATLEEAGIVALPGDVLFEGNVHHEPALPQDQDAIGEAQGLLDVVGDQQDGWLVCPAEGRHQVLHLQAREGIERGERLVEEQQLRLANQGAGQGHPLGLAARQGPWPSPDVTGEAHLGQ